MIQPNGILNVEKELTKEEVTAIASHLRSIADKIDQRGVYAVWGWNEIIDAEDTTMPGDTVKSSKPGRHFTFLLDLIFKRD